MRLHCVLSALMLALVFCAAPIRAETITRAEYRNPVERYGHFALGRPHEYSRLTATTDSGRSVELELAEAEVFEDLAPRLVKLAPGAPNEILAIVSRRDSGARLVLFGLDGGQLKIIAQSQAIGTPMRWLNPVGVADLDGDGRAEIAAVITPHIGGTLKIYRRVGGDLLEVAALAGFSNHVYGSPELRLSATALIAGRMRLLVPDNTRRYLRVITLTGDRLVETGRCPLRAPITGAISMNASSEITVGLAAGQQVLAMDDCRR